MSEQQELVKLIGQRDQFRPEPEYQGQADKLVEMLNRIFGKKTRPSMVSGYAPPKEDYSGPMMYPPVL